ncbi:MAG: hypothetical protein HY077_00190 [Elusimicrobia bacterium]|nr:hypothetical protein [Elusimicrobiota bacterium]
MTKNTVVVLSLALLCGPAFAAEQPVMGLLMQDAAVSELPDVAPAAAKAVANPDPAALKSTFACTMDVQYTEKLVGLVVYRKKINGTAVVHCPGNRPVELSLEGRGVALGIGIPNNGLFHSIGTGFAGNLQIRVPFPFVPKNFEGEYLNVGGSTPIGGVAVSPWTNTDGSANVTIYLPTNVNASFNASLTSLTFKLR